MSVINSQPLIGASGNQGGAYNLTRSIRLRSSAPGYFNRTPTTAGNRRTWTFSTWVKRGELGRYQAVWFSGDNGTDTYGLAFDSDNTINVGRFLGGTGWTWLLDTTAVYRDVSAWYHIVVAIDTTQATASNRVKLYVNGSQVTSFGTANYPTQNFDTEVNSTSFIHRIGFQTTSNSYAFDGYLAETNFIDGQQLEPSSFGETDTATGVWKPKKYTGTYGTNGFYLPFSVSQTSSYSASFNGSSQYLSFPNSSNFAFGTGAFTIEGWFNGSSGQNDKFILGGRSAIGTMHITTGGASGSTAGALRYVGSSTITSGTALVSSGSWNHWAVTRDGSNNVKLWINGQEVGSGTDTTNYSTTSGTWYVATNDLGAGSNLLSGNLSNLRIVKGSAVYTAKFAPPSADLTAISGTGLLTLQSSTIVDNSGNSVSITNTGTVATAVDYPFSASISYDSSGNNNNWVANNISLTSGSTYDSMKDVPTLTDADTANYCVMNPLEKGTAYSISNGNLTVNINASLPVFASAKATFGITSGKWYWEVVKTSSGVAVVQSGVWATDNLSVGLNTDLNGNTGSLTNIGMFGATASNALVKTGLNTIDFTTLGSYTNGDVIGIAFDADAGKLYAYKNNTEFTGQNISNGTSILPTMATGKTYQPYVYSGNGGSGTETATININFGQRPFAYTPPSGFKALNTFNLPTPTIGATASTQANKYFDATTYTGNGSTLSVVNAGGFQPDLVWYKGRSAAYNHRLFDAIRGATKDLQSNSTDAEGTISGLTAFNSNGFTLGSEVGGNNNGSTYVAWQWNGGGSNATNTSGTITSTVRANTSAGFSIVTYTGNGVSNATVGHGLGVAPKLVILKSRSSNSTSNNWWVNHASLSSGNNLYLNLGDAQFAISGTTSGGLGTLSSTTFTLANGASNNNNVNQSSGTFVAYCFTDVAGYSAFGRYTGNGSTDGPFIYLGFRPRFIMIKRSDVGAAWSILDTARNTTNVVNRYLYPNLADAEYDGGTTYPFDYLSNGFKIRGSGSSENANGGTFIYAAFAENPFKYSLAR